MCACVDGFYTSLSCGHQSEGDAGEIKRLYEGPSLQPGLVTPLINIKYFSSSNMTWDSEDRTSSYIGSVETNLLPLYADISNEKL